MRDATRALARLYPWEASASRELQRAVAFLDWEIRPATVVSAGYGLGIVVLLVVLVVTVLVPPPWRMATATGGLAVVLVTIHVVHVGPRLLATARRTAALGTAPELVVLAVLRMRLAPSPERAATFAAETASGRLSRSLEGHVRRARGTGRTGLERFGDEWHEWFPTLGRALALVGAAGSVPDHDRARTLDQAVSVVLDGTREQMRAYAASIRGPTTALYAFGVLLPTALVGLLPAARAAGLAVTAPVIALVYDVGLPAVLVGTSAWLLARRPVAFPPPALDAGHPAVPDRRRAATVGAVVVGLGAAVVTARVLPLWAPPIALCGAGGGTGLVIYYRPYVRQLRRIAAVEAGLTDALSLIGRRVSNGQPVERAIETAAGDVSGEIGDVLARGARQGRQLDVGVDTAFRGTHGVLEAVPSPRVRGSVALLDVAAREGAPAGRAILSVAGHVDELRQVERDARADIQSVLETLRSTAALFGPLVGGATVALARHMAGSGGTLLGATEPTPWLGLLVGWYVLVLAVVLTALSVGLERGLDRRLLGYRIGVALLLATGSFLGGYTLTAAVA